VAGAIIVSIGKFIFQMGLVIFIASTITAPILMAFGVPLPDWFRRATTIISLVGLGSILTSFTTRVFIPQLAQSMGVSMYLSLFLPASVSIVTTIVSLLNMLPTLPAVSSTLSVFLSSFALFAVHYYFAVKLGIVPPE